MRPTEPGAPGEPDVQLRLATADDLDEVAELFIATRRDAVPQMPAVVSDDDAIRRWFRDNQPGHEIWVAEDGEVVGFAMLSGDWLPSLYVGPHRQGSGIGSMLLDLVKSLRPDGFGLWVFASNARARGFYHRHGLVELEHTDGSQNAEKAPDVRMVWPGRDPLAYLRRQIDEVDDELALLLARRFALTATVQGFKQTPGQSGRDLGREAEIAARMAAHAPGLGIAAIGRIMHTVIGESLDAYERTENSVTPPAEPHP